MQKPKRPNPRLWPRLFVACALGLWGVGLLVPEAWGHGGMSASVSQSSPSFASLSFASLSFERVYASPALNGPGPRAVRLSPDGRWLTLLRNRVDDRERYDLWGYDRQAQRWQMLVDSAKLSSGRALSEAEKMQRERARIGDLKGIVAYEWSTDGKGLLVPLDGDLFLAGLDGATRQLPTGGVAMAPQLSPGGRYLSFLRDQRLWVAPLEGQGAAHPISPEETASTVHWGEAEFVAQEEMARMAGHWWSPDARHIAAERFDEGAVDVVTRAAIGASSTTTFEQRYPLAGGANAAVSLWIMAPDGSGRLRVDLGSNPDIYLARVNWSPDGGMLYVQRQNRAQTRLDMLAVDPATGKSRILFSEEAAPGGWITLSDNYRFLKDGSLIWWSQRDGHGHLWHFTRPGGTAGHWRQLTHGDWEVTALVGVDEKAGRLFFTGTRDDPLSTQIYALNLAAPDHVARLSDLAFVNGASMDRTGHTLVVSRSSASQPTQVYIADSAGQHLEWVEENRLDAAHPYAPHLPAQRMPTYGTLTAEDGSLLHWRMITPVMEPGKRYPVFFEHYGGPGVQVVNRGWGGALAQAIVAHGYIYFELDNRGSACRSVAFQQQISRAMGTVEVADQLAGARYLQTLPFVDSGKIATYGWSYGGYLTLKMLEAHPGVFAAGIAGAPVTRWELYDTHYTERYLGDPKAAPEVYAKAGALEDAAKIHDPLLLIHGMADDNVVFENSSELIARMQAEGVPFEMMLYPGYTHRVSGPRVGPHLWNTIFTFLARHGVTPPK